MKRFLVFFISLLFVTSAYALKKVLMMLPNDFMWPEYSIPMQEYKNAGYDVKVAAKFKEPTFPDRRNKEAYKDSKAVNPDLSFSEVRVQEFDAITFVAGNGAWHDFFPNQEVHNIVIEAFKKNKVIGLLCASTGLLGLVNNWDGSGKPLAAGRKVVGYFRVEGILKELGKVKYISGGVKEPGVAVDKKLVTGRNPESSQLFAEAVVKTLNQKQ